MTRYVFSGGTSNKFWEGRVEGTTLTVLFGRIGTVGQTRSKKLRTPADASAALAKLVLEKTRSGYRAEKGGAAASRTVRAPARAASRASSKDVGMKLTREEKVLAEGSDEALLDLMESRAAVVVDWRAFFDEIVDDFGRFLPKRYLELDESDKKVVSLRTKHAVAKVPLAKNPPFGLDVAAAIASILPPGFEAHAFAMSLDSDTHCYLVRRSEWWDAFRAAFPRRYRSVFAKSSALPKRFVVEAVGT